MLLFAEINTQRNGDAAQDDYRGIAIFPAQFRHGGKIHAVPSGDQRQRHEDSGDDSEDFHDVILADIDLGLIYFPNLRGIFSQHQRFFMQTPDPLAEQAQGCQFAACKEALTVLLEDAAYVGQLQVVVGIYQDLPAACG